MGALRAPPAWHPPPNEVKYTRVVQAHLESLDGGHDPLGKRLSYMAAWAHLSRAKPERLQHTVLERSDVSGVSTQCD